MMVYVDRTIRVPISVIDDKFIELNYSAYQADDGIEVQVHLQETTLDQFQQEIRRRHPELTEELDQIRNDLAIGNGEVKP